MPAADGAAAQVGPQSTAQFNGPADPEPFLEGSVVIPPGAQNSPESVSHVVQGALEFLKPFGRGAAERQPHLDGPKRGLESGHLLREARLRHGASPTLDRRRPRR